MTRRSGAKVTAAISAPLVASSIDARSLPDCTFCIYTSRLNETEITRAAVPHCADSIAKERIRSLRVLESLLSVWLLVCVSQVLNGIERSLRSLREDKRECVIVEFSV